MNLRAFNGRIITPAEIDVAAPGASDVSDMVERQAYPDVLVDSKRQCVRSARSARNAALLAVSDRSSKPTVICVFLEHPRAMTFYNVISGILFLGACQAILRFLGTPAAWAAATLAMIVCNEAIMTSELVERQASPTDYGMDLKLLDLLTFVLLASALVVLSPGDNTFGTNAGSNFPGANSPVVFLGLLAAYWLVTIAWNRRAKQDSEQLWGARLRYAPRVLAGLFAIGAMVAWLSGTTHFSSTHVDWFWIFGASVALYLMLKLRRTLKRARPAPADGPELAPIVEDARRSAAAAAEAAARAESHASAAAASVARAEGLGSPPVQVPDDATVVDPATHDVVKDK